jgi:hypothetical protein
MKNIKEIPTNRQLVKNNFNTILWFILLVVISLFLGLLPTLSFGQAFQESLSLSTPNDSTSSLPTVPTTPASTIPTDSTTNGQSNDFSIPTSPLSSVSPSYSPKMPTPQNIDSSGQTPQLLPNRSENLRSVVDSNHPFVRYFALPKESQSLIKGQPYTIAQLLEGTKTSSSRRRLLQTYWELTGLLAEYNIRCEAERLSGSRQDMQQNFVTDLLQQQRRSVEMEFVKKQWQLIGLLQHFKKISVSEKEFPIPCDYPLFKRYETFADKIARTARSQYLGHLIPVQEQLIDARHRSCMIIFEMLQNIPQDTRQLLEVLNQRTTAFLELVEAVIDYNKMIAEYTSETIPPEVNGVRLVGALIELPKINSPKPNSSIPSAPMSNLQTPNLSVSDQSTEHTVPEVSKLSETSQINSQTKISSSNLVPQRLPADISLPPIEPAIIQASHVEPQ